MHAEEAVPSQHSLSDQMEEAAKEWFSAGPHDKVNFEVNLMVAPGPLGELATNSDLLSAWHVVPAQLGLFSMHLEPHFWTYSSCIVCGSKLMPTSSCVLLAPDSG